MPGFHLLILKNRFPILEIDNPGLRTDNRIPVNDLYISICVQRMSRSNKGKGNIQLITGCKGSLFSSLWLPLQI